MKKIGAFVGLLLVAVVSGAWFPHGSGVGQGHMLLNPSLPSVNAFVNQLKACKNAQVTLVSGQTYAYPNYLSEDGYPTQSPPSAKVSNYFCGVSILDGTTTTTDAVDNGSGFIRLSLVTTLGMHTGDSVNITSVNGTTNANGTNTIAVINTTQIDLPGVVFNAPYTSSPNAVVWDSSATGAYSGANCPSLPGSNCTWVIKWKGTFGTGGVAGVSLNGAAVGTWSTTCTGCSDPGSCVVSKTNGAVTLTGTDCTVTFQAPGSSTVGGMALHFIPINYTSHPSGEISNVTEIDLYRADRATNFANNEIYDPDYLAYKRAMNFRTLRFLDWSDVTFGNNPAFWAYSPVTAFSWLKDRWEPKAWVGSDGSPGCTSSDGGSTYTASAPSGWPGGWPGNVQGVFIQCEVSTSSLAGKPTLNVNGAGAAQVVIGLSANASPTLGAGALTANAMVTLVYNKQLNLWLLFNQNYPYGSGALSYTIPLAAITDLCNQLNADCWLQTQTLFENADAAAMATQAAADLKPSLKAYFEYSNEIFNIGNTQTFYAAAMGHSIGWTDASYGNQAAFTFNGFKIKQLNDAMLAVWPGSNAPQFNGVMTSQLGSYAQSSEYKLSGEALTLNSTGGTYPFTYVANCSPSCNLNYTTAPNRPVDVTTTISVGMYYGAPDMQGGSALTSIVNSACTINLYSVCPYTQLESSTTSTVTISAMNGGSPTTVTASGGSIANWQNGDRVQLLGTSFSPTLQYAWTTISNLSGSGPYAFQLSNTTDSSGTIITDSGYTGTGTALRAIPGSLITITSANPGVVTWSGAHNLIAGSSVIFELTGAGGALPTNVTAATTYYVLNDANFSSNTFDFAASPGGTPINTTAGTQSGTPTAYGTYPGQNSALVAAATQYALGDPTNQAVALNWALADMNDNNWKQTYGIAGSYQFLHTWLPGWLAICATAGYPPLKFLSYEGGFDVVGIGSKNGLSLSLTATQISNINTFIVAFKNSSQLATGVTSFLQGFKALSSSCTEQNLAQYLDTGSITYTWSLTYGNIYNYAVGAGSWASFGAIANFNNAP